MSTRIAGICVLVLLVGAAMALAGDMAWFDMQNCSMCKPLAETPGLMESVTWEQHKISNGFVSLGTVTEDKLEAYRACDAKMEETGAKLMAGEEMPLCGSCQALSGLMGRGAKMESVKTEMGSMMIVTADDEALVKDLHAYVDKNHAEMAKMMTEMVDKKAEAGHEGHDH